MRHAELLHGVNTNHSTFNPILRVCSRLLLGPLSVGAIFLAASSVFASGRKAIARTAYGMIVSGEEVSLSAWID
jgi:hypothetical protein